jgi:hypothetical protein
MYNFSIPSKLKAWIDNIAAGYSGGFLTAGMAPTQKSLFVFADLSFEQAQHDGPPRPLLARSTSVEEPAEPRGVAD